MSKIYSRRFFVLALFCAVLCMAPSLFAQVPVPPIQDQPQPVLVTDPVQAQVTPDDQPLTSGQEGGFGSWGPRHSFITPSIRVAENLQSNPLLLRDSSGSYRGFTSFGGDAQLVKYFGRDAEIRYAGVVRYDTYAELQGSDKFTNAHDFLLSKRIVFRNWQLRFDDEAQYSQGSNFGASGMEGMGGVVGQLWQWSGLSNLQLGSSTLRPDLLPNQTILSGRVGRVANTALAEADFRVSPRDILTVGGTYSLLHFTSDLLLDSRQASGILGFNHNISPRDSVAVEAMYTHFMFVDTPDTIDITGITLLYGRRLTGRLSMDVGAGPIIERTHLDTLAPATGTHGETDWQGRASLHYRTSRAMLTLHGERSFSAGSGVFLGAMTSSGMGSANITLSRNWSSSVLFGVSRNEQANSAIVYNTQFAGVTINRRLGFNTNIFASYNLERQTSGSNCTELVCQFGGTRNVFGIGLSWTGKPISLQ